MRLSKADEGGPQEFEINMTPMIDVIFQLVLFFVFSMKFMAFEGQINAFLPKDRGLDSTAPDGCGACCGAGSSPWCPSFRSGTAS